MAQIPIHNSNQTTTTNHIVSNVHHQVLNTIPMGLTNQDQLSSVTSPALQQPSLIQTHPPVAQIIQTRLPTSQVVQNSGPRAPLITSKITSRPFMQSPNVAVPLRPPNIQTTKGQQPVVPSQVSNDILAKQRVKELVNEVDPSIQLDDEVEDLLMQITDDFIETVVSSSCQFAKHRMSQSLDVKDVQLHLEQSWGIQVPGFSLEDPKPPKRVFSSEAHKQRMTLIRKSQKKSST